MSNVIPLQTMLPPMDGAEAYPTSCRRIIGSGFALIITTFVGLGGWMTFAPLESATIAAGTVVVDSKRKTVQHLEGGVIREIMVRDGDKVRMDEVLLRLDGAHIRAALASVEPMLHTNTAQKARLLAEKEGLSAIVFPDELMSSKHAAAKEIMNRQVRLFDVRRGELDGELALLSNRLAQSVVEHQGLQKQIKGKIEQIELIREELEGLEDLFDRGFTTRKQVFLTRRALRQIEGELTDYRAQAQDSTASAEYYFLQQHQLRRSFLEEVETQLQEVEKERYKLLEAMRAISDQYDRLDVRAPVSGTVVNLAAHTVGGVIAPGSRIMDLVPDDDELVIEAQIQPHDVDGLHVGLDAQVRFASFDRYDLPWLRGTLEMLSADRLTDSSEGKSYFLARIRVSDGEVKRLSHLRLIPGMPAEVMISRGNRTPLSYLAAPIAEIAFRAFRE